MASAPQSTAAHDPRPRDGKTGEKTGYHAPPGLYLRPEARGFGQIEISAALGSALWLLGCALGFLLLPSAEGPDSDPLRMVMTAMVVVFPVALIWVVAVTLRAARIMREESQRLQSAIDAIRKTYISQAQGGVAEPSIARKLDEIAATTRKAEAALTVFTSSRAAMPLPEMSGPHGSVQGTPAPQPTDPQPSLALGTPAEHLAPPLAAADFIRALNFPETAEDADGFAALRRALKDRATAQLVQASQDVLTLMSQDGIYMDDLRPDPARSEIWRAFAAGTRGREVAGLGGIRDRASLALVTGRMKQDPIFRDAGHHFLRVFDRVFADFAERASDAEIQSFATTRTARAFMLLGRVAGTFD